ncbi:hypothetical protein RvY_08911, partial [Ramazzottius varieornatus]
MFCGEDVYLCSPDVSKCTGAQWKRHSAESTKVRRAEREKWVSFSANMTIWCAQERLSIVNASK